MRDIMYAIMLASDYFFYLICDDSKLFEYERELIVDTKAAVCS